MAGCSDYHQDCDHDGDNTNDGTGDDHDGGGGDGHVSNVYHHDDDGNNNVIMIIMVLGEGVMMTIKMTMMTLSWRWCFMWSDTYQQTKMHGVWIKAQTTHDIVQRSDTMTVMTSRRDDL